MARCQCQTITSQKPATVGNPQDMNLGASLSSQSVRACGRALAVGLAAAGSLSSVATAGAQSLPQCPPSDEAVTTYPPDYVRVGQSYKLSAESYSSATNLRLTVDGAPAPLSQHAGQSSVILPGPAKTGSIDVVFEWDQDQGLATACRGSDRYRVPVIGAKGKAGRVDYPRISGRYRVRYRNGNIKLSREDRNAVWRMAPGCRYFGCATRLLSNGGLKATFRPSSGLSYGFDRGAGSGGSCQVRNLITGDVTRIRPAFFLSVRYELRSTKTVNGVAQRIAGKRVIRAAITSRCGGGVRYYTSYFRGTRK